MRLRRIYCEAIVRESCPQFRDKRAWKEVAAGRSAALEQARQRLVAGKRNIIGVPGIDAMSGLREALELLVHAETDHIRDHRAAWSALWKTAPVTAYARHDIGRIVFNSDSFEEASNTVLGNR